MWLEVKCALQVVTDMMKKYECILRKKNMQMKDYFAKKEPVRRPLKDGECYTLEKHSTVTPQLSIIDDIIKDQKEYIPIFLSDYPQISALSKLKRYTLFEVLKTGHLSRPIVYFKYTPYSGIATSHFVWVLPDDTRDYSMYAEITADISSQIPVFHTRAMQSEFKDHFTSVCKLTPAIYRAMYRYLSGDASANPNKVSKETDERLKLALTSGDPSIVYDLRGLNLGRHAKYDDFWDVIFQPPLKSAGMATSYFYLLLSLSKT